MKSSPSGVTLSYLALQVAPHAGAWIEIVFGGHPTGVEKLVERGQVPMRVRGLKITETSKDLQYPLMIRHVFFENGGPPKRCRGVETAKGIEPYMDNIIPGRSERRSEAFHYACQMVVDFRQKDGGYALGPGCGREDIDPANTANTAPMSV